MVAELLFDVYCVYILLTNMNFSIFFLQDQYGNNCYIASQGPVPNTVYDFWRMILQYKVKVIAMACRLVEIGRVSRLEDCSVWVQEKPEKL